MFDKIYKKLEKELREKKKQMATIIELSNQAYEARDGAQLEIAAIQQTMQRERAEFEEQMVHTQLSPPSPCPRPAQPHPRVAHNLLANLLDTCFFFLCVAGTIPQDH